MLIHIMCKGEEKGSKKSTKKERKKGKKRIERAEEKSLECTKTEPNLAGVEKETRSEVKVEWAADVARTDVTIPK